MTEQYYAVTKDQDGRLQLMGGPYGTKEAALLGGEMNLVNTWGTKHKDYTWLLNGLTPINSSEAGYLKLV
jgi:hypothetical protein